MLPMRKVQSWLPAIFNDLLENEWLAKMNDTAPSMNIMECDERYRVEIATPGMTKDDFSIEVKNDNQLEVTMEKKSEATTEESELKDQKCGCTAKEKEVEEQKQGKYIRREFAYSHFRQTLILPENVDKFKITAKQENGILTIFIPKKESVIEMQTVKKIAVE